MTKRQEKVLEAKDRVVLVTGGPGTGKTATALWAGREAILTSHVAHDQYVLYLTFSRSAVSQILRRAPGVLADVRRQIEVSTFHGLAFRLLRAFGRYAGFGIEVPRIQSKAAEKLFGPQAGMVRYDDLVPDALKLLDREWIAHLVTHRWPLVISDEFQDTGDDQWELIQRVGANARLLLLADPDQMIHDFRGDVRPERLKQARQLATVEIELEEGSHRDETGIVPHLAKAVLGRRFDDEAVAAALKGEALRIVPDIPLDQLGPRVGEEVGSLRKSGCATVGVFGFSNDGSTRLASQLTALGIGNTIVGIPESHGEGLRSIGILLAHAIGEASLTEVKVAFATFLTSVSRGGTAPPLARLLVGQGDLPAEAEQLLREISRRLVEVGSTGTIGDVLKVVRGAWSSFIADGTGARLWLRAFGSFIDLTDGVAPQAATPERVRALLDRAEQARAVALASELDETRGMPVQLMNFHQTKGREADAVVLVFRPNDYYVHWAEDREPYEKRSRLLFVAISRARHKVTVILPPRPHQLVAPFRALAATS